MHSYGIALKTGRILLEASPIHLNLDSITEDLLAVRNSFNGIDSH
jgi:solute carrier family 30 (zinc transporter), member 1